MKNTLLLLAVGALLLSAANANPPRAAKAQTATAQTERIPVIVELFTSEGCSSCPPADILLSKLETLQPVEGAEIIGLEEHVDYWNHDGWVDPYSDPEWTLRQQEYVERFKGKSPYTPQMVVDGQSQFVGYNARDALKAIREDAKQTRMQVSITTEGAGRKMPSGWKCASGTPALHLMIRPTSGWR